VYSSPQTPPTLGLFRSAALIAAGIGGQTNQPTPGNAILHAVPTPMAMISAVLILIHQWSRSNPAWIPASIAATGTTVVAAHFSASAR
jgi:hypothetical protein